MWNWSFRAFRMFGTDVRIHWSLPAYVLYYVVRGQRAGYAPLTLLLWVIAPMLLLFASVVCHEFGHVFAARYFGQRTSSMILTPIGGMVMVAQGRTPRAEFAVAAAGPAVNLGLALLGACIYFVAGGAASLELLLPMLDHDLLSRLWAEGSYFRFSLADFVETNVVLFLFNVLLVAYPLDGGRVLFSILWRRRGYRRALALTCRIAQVLAVGLGLLAVAWQNAMLGIIAFFVFFQASATAQQVPLLTDPGGGPRPAGRAEPGSKGGREARGGWFEGWQRARRARRAKALVAKADRHGLNALSPEERAFLRQMRWRGTDPRNRPN